MFENLYAMGAGGGTQGGGYSFFIMIAIVFAIMYFFMIRPQAKKQKERQKMLDALQKGDQVVTIGGVHGKIMGFKNDDKVVIVKVDDNVKLDIERTAISSVLKSS
ncbi:MAG: preprotein translocase subunit YajC [Calditrichia bacterium]